ncbi:hypothetical protein SCHPADRAFT_840688, partial [Schizopora paradoxa]
MITRGTILQELNQLSPSKTFSVDIFNENHTQCVPYQAAVACNAISVIAADDLEDLRSKQEADEYFGKVLETFRSNDKACYIYPQYYIADNGLCYFEDSIGGTRICVPESNRIDLITEAHECITETGHAG